MVEPATSMGAEGLATVWEPASIKINWVTLLDFFVALYTFLGKVGDAGAVGRPTVSTRVVGEDFA
jgi:hypothetical protein